MTLLDRYIIREFLKIFLFGTLALLLVSTIVDLFEIVNHLVEHDPPLSVIVTYFIARTPQVVIMMTPVAMLLSTLLVTGTFARNSEIIAMLASGVSVYRIIVPLLLIGTLVSVLMFGFNEFVVPAANRLTEQTKRIIRGKPDLRNAAKIRLWFRFREGARDRIYYMNALAPEELKIYGLTIFELDENFLPVKRIDASWADYHLPPSLADSADDASDRPAWMSRFVPRHFQDFLSSEIQDNQPQDMGQWVLYKGTERTFTPSGTRSIIMFDERPDYDIPHTFQEFRRDTKEPEDMNYQELADYIDTLTQSGYDMSKYVVDLRAKFSYPVVSFVMVIIGFPFALKSPRSGAAMGFGLSVFIGLAYWITLQLGISLGHAHILPPTLAAWISHIIFATAGCYLLLSTRS